MTEKLKRPRSKYPTTQFLYDRQGALNKEFYALCGLLEHINRMEDRIERLESAIQTMSGDDDGQSDES